MPKKKARRGGGRRRRKKVPPKKKSSPPMVSQEVDALRPLVGNFLPQCSPGCHVAHYVSDWILGVEPFDPESFGIDEDSAQSVPDLSIDPSQGLFSVINTSDATDKVYYVTISGIRGAIGRKGSLAFGESVDGVSGAKRECITFVLVVNPLQVMDVCTLVMGPKGVESLDLYSDVSELKLHRAPDLFDPSRVYPFPLEGSMPFQCTQGMGGHFTHFYSATHHAIDFACPVGTPVLALGDGMVKEIKQSETAMGIHVGNLFHWNSMLLQLDDGMFVEYVHIQQDSATVGVGDRVSRCQVICLSGQVGFCPQPHLHIQMHCSEDPKAPTVKFAFESLDPGPGEPRHFIPIAGQWYNKNGMVKDVQGESTTEG